eukprot:Skav226647  [mRNA]  locus=scaffold1:84513:85176:- [translate_table: standard]
MQAQLDNKILKQELCRLFYYLPKFVLGAIVVSSVSKLIAYDVAFTLCSSQLKNLGTQREDVPENQNAVRSNVFNGLRPSR